jgi:hypothetical protein
MAVSDSTSLLRVTIEASRANPSAGTGLGVVAEVENTRRVGRVGIAIGFLANYAGTKVLDKITRETARDTTEAVQAGPGDSASAPREEDGPTA